MPRSSKTTRRPDGPWTATWWIRRRNGRTQYRRPTASTSDEDVERASEIDDITDSLRRPDGDVDGEFDALVAELDYSDVDVPVLLAERAEYKDLAQRVQADFDNYRKRSAAQSLAEADRASEGWPRPCCPCSMLPRRRSCDMRMIVGPLLNQMLTELKKHGLESLDLEGKPFDPEFAEAVAHEPGGGGEPMVSEVLRSGSTWKGKVLASRWCRPETESDPGCGPRGGGIDDDVRDVTLSRRATSRTLGCRVDGDGQGDHQGVPQARP